MLSVDPFRLSMLRRAEGLRPHMQIKLANNYHRDNWLVAAKGS